jgi:P27 family predicted phage terminase small subunit
MKTGPRPQPTKIKILKGNPGRRPLPEGEPEPEAKIPQCPKHLDKEARKEWRRMSRLLFELGLLTEIDRAALAAYCVSWSRWIKAEEKLKTEDVICVTTKGWAFQNPWLSVSRAALKDMHIFLSEFGMTPSARTRVKATPPKEQDPKERLARQLMG